MFPRCECGRGAIGVLEQSAGVITIGSSIDIIDVIVDTGMIDAGICSDIVVSMVLLLLHLLLHLLLLLVVQG